MYAECDALSVDVSIYDEEFKKLCSRYKKILSENSEFIKYVKDMINI